MSHQNNPIVGYNFFSHNVLTQKTTLEIREILLLCEIFRGCYLYNLNPLEVIRLVSSLQLAVLYPKILNFSDFMHIVNSHRNTSTPGVNAIPYRVYKKCPQNLFVFV